nr:hypothetical protein [Dyella sp. ASV24]
MASKRVIQITISDPATVLLLQRYRQFLVEEESVGGSMQQIVEGIALAFMDEHDSFRAWCTKRAPADTTETHV